MDCSYIPDLYGAVIPSNEQEMSSFLSEVCVYNNENFLSNRLKHTKSTIIWISEESEERINSICRKKNYHHSDCQSYLKNTVIVTDDRGAFVYAKIYPKYYSEIQSIDLVRSLIESKTTNKSTIIFNYD